MGWLGIGALLPKAVEESRRWLPAAPSPWERGAAKAGVMKAQRNTGMCKALSQAGDYCGKKGRKAIQGYCWSVIQL